MLPDNLDPLASGEARQEYVAQDTGDYTDLDPLASGEARLTFVFDYWSAGII